LIRDWQARDSTSASEVIRSVLTDYGLPWEPMGADLDVINVEECYLTIGGEFWVVEWQNTIVGTGAYYPIKRGKNAVEIRKMYLLPIARGKGLGRYLLQELENAIARRGFEQIWIETASVLAEAVKLYETSGYLPTEGVETARCDSASAHAGLRIYVKSLRRS